MRTAVLSVLAPAFVLAAFVIGLWTYRDSEERTADLNAGWIFNATVTRDGAVAAINRLLEAKRPRVIVLGPSYANTDISPELLAERMGLERGDVALLSVPNSVGSHWYAILKYRVFEPGHRPEHIIVVSGLQSMLLNTPLTESSRVNLDVHLPPEGGDAVLTERVAHSGALWWGRLKDQRTKVRDAIFSVLRDRPVRALAATKRRTLQSDDVRKALDKVFADEVVDPVRLSRNRAVTAIDTEAHGYDLSVLPKPEASFLGPITELASASGAHITWVRPPMEPGIPAELDDVVPEGFEAAAREVVEGAGGAFLDLRRLPMTEAMFRNADHMNKEGSRRFTLAVAEALRESGWGAPVLYRPRKVERHGGGEAALPSADGRALHAGGELQLHFDPWPGGPFEGAAEMVGGRAPPVGKAGGHDIAWVANGKGWSGSWKGAPPQGPWTLTMATEEAALLTGLRWGQGPSFGTLLGEGSVSEDVWVDVLHAPGTDIQFARAPVGVPGSERPRFREAGPLSRFQTEKWGFLSDEALLGVTQFEERCSPLRVVEDDRLLGGANAPCGDVIRHGHGRSCHGPTAILFSAGDGSDPDTNGRSYNLVLDLGRRCGKRWWVYPKDHLTLTTAARPGPVDQVRLGLRYLQYRDATLQVRVRVGDALVVEEAVSSRAWAAGSLTWSLGRAVQPDEKITIELESLDYVFYLFEGADVGLVRSGGP